MEQFSGKVYRLAYGITRDSADAEEVVQDVFLTAFAKIKSFEARAALGTWIYRITTNVALNRRRGRRYEREVPLEECLPTFKADGHREGDRSFVLADWSGTPEEELMSAEGRCVLARAVESLPAHYRSVLVLRDVEGLSNDEVAEIVGDSVSSVKSRLHRARMAVREQITRHRARNSLTTSAHH